MQRGKNGNIRFGVVCGVALLGLGGPGLSLSENLSSGLGITEAHAASARWWPETTRANAAADGAEGREYIKGIQNLLQARGYKLMADGIFGAKTENAIKAFQRKNRIIASGKVNGPTWEALVVSQRQGNRGNAVRAIQRYLRYAAYDVPVDGIFGPKTRQAVLKFQKTNGIKQDGIVGLNTWCFLIGGNLAGPAVG